MRRPTESPLSGFPCRTPGSGRSIGSAAGRSNPRSTGRCLPCRRLSVRAQPRLDRGADVPWRPARRPRHVGRRHGLSVVDNDDRWHGRICSRQHSRLPTFVPPSGAASRRPPAARVLVLDTGLRTLTVPASRPSTRDAEHCKLHKPWFRDPAVGPRTMRTSMTMTAPGCSTSKRGTARSSPASSARCAPMQKLKSPAASRALAKATKPPSSTRSAADRCRRAATRDRRDELRRLLPERRSRDLRRQARRATRGHLDRRRGRQPAHLPPVLPGGVAGRHRCRRACRRRKAWFTNFGGWVDACAPAIDVVSTFFMDFTENIDGVETRRYEGWASWSGTSFSAPKVAAAIAQEMYLNLDARPTT